MEKEILFNVPKDLLTEEDLKELEKVLKEEQNSKKQDLYDNVNKPKHYAGTKIEVIDYIEDKELGFCLGNAVKYISRAGRKDPNKEIEDLQKAIWYINRRIQELQEGKCL